MSEGPLMKDEVHAAVGAAIEVHHQLRHGFAEAVYEEAFEIELSIRGPSYVPKLQTPIFYKGRERNNRYEADVCCFGAVIVESRSAQCLTSADQGQLLNYLKATSHEVGLLINFGAIGRLAWKRMVRTDRYPVDLEDIFDQ